MIFYVAAPNIWKEPKNNENQEITFCLKFLVIALQFDLIWFKFSLDYNV